MARETEALPCSGDWSSLHDLPLFTIASSISSPSDFSSFSHSCSSWRSASKAALRPFLSSLPPFLCSVHYDHLYSLPDNTSFSRNHRSHWALGSSPSGILLLADSSSLRHLSLAHPLSGHVIHRFPPIPLPFSRALLTPDLTLLLFNSSSIQYSSPHDPLWRTYPLHPYHPIHGPIRNMAVFGSRIYVLSANGKLGTLHLGERPELAYMEEAEDVPVGLSQSTWLGESGGELLVVTCRYNFGCVGGIGGFVVRRFVLGEGRWEKVETLGGRALFLDMSWGLLSEEVGRWRGVKGNCVYYTDPVRNVVGMFDMKKGEVEEVEVGKGREGVRWDLAVWVIPSLCC